MKNKLSAKMSGNRNVNGLVMAAAVILFLLSAASAQAAERQKLHGHVPKAVAHLQPMGHLADTNRLHLAIGLPLRNQEALDELLRQIYDPASPNYRQYLTPEEFTEMFGPAEEDYQAVIAFAKAQGLTVTCTHANRVVLDVSGSLPEIEKAFHVTLKVYQHPEEARTFYAPNAEPSLDLAVPVLDVSGLDNYSLPHPNHKIKPVDKSVTITPNFGSGPFQGAYMGCDFRAAYAPGVTLDGSGQIVGLVAFDGYNASDIGYYEQLASLPSVTLSNVLISGASGVPSGYTGSEEVCLDIEMAISMAPGLDEMIVYEVPDNPSYWVDVLSRMANDNLAKQLSCSWTSAGGPQAADQIFQQMAAQGQSFFVVSGDCDDYTGTIPFPSDNPWVTSVGGTTLSTTGPCGSLTAETVWNTHNGACGSAGGISTTYLIPDYQLNIDMSNNQGSTIWRNIPDVALTADRVYVRANGTNYSVMGTSCAAPLWAGFAALANQQAAASCKPALGLINSAVYAIGSGANYTLDFHDITDGNNYKGFGPNQFYAVVRYDLCTGWGTPKGQNLINDFAQPLANTPPAIANQPESQIVYLGNNVMFRVDATGTLPFNYQWQHCSTNLPGKTSRTLTINNVQQGDAGNYAVRVSNASGYILSSSALLTVLVPPQVVYSTPGTYTWECPQGVTSLQVDCWGAGGGGGQTDPSGYVGTGAGGGGAYAGSVLNVIPGTYYTIVVGAGGNGGGANGGDSSFASTVVVAKGGTSGPPHGTNGAAGGQASACTGTTKYSGGNGGNFSQTQTQTGGGGGSAGNLSAGGNGGTPTGGTGGSGTDAAHQGAAGGAGAPSFPAPPFRGSNGGNPGGGGGGSFRGNAPAAIQGGAGGSGKVILTTNPNP